MNGFLPKNINWSIFTPALLLLIISLTVLFSIDTGYFRSQLFFGIISIVCFLVVSQIQFKLLQHYSTPIYIGSLIILFLLLLLGIESRGAMRWFEILGLRVQFSEILKPFLLIALASYLANHPINLKTFLTIGIASLPIIGLIVKQPDLGSGLMYAFTLLLTLIVAGFPWYWFG